MGVERTAPGGLAGQAIDRSMSRAGICRCRVRGQCRVGTPQDWPHHSHFGAYTNQHRDTNSNSYAHAHTNGHTGANRNAHANSNKHANAHTDANCNGHADPNKHANANVHGRSHILDNLFAICGTQSTGRGQPRGLVSLPRSWYTQMICHGTPVSNVL